MEKFQDTTKGHEQYLRHLLLLGQAAPIPLREIVRRAISSRGERLEGVLSEAKATFRLLFPSQFRKLFADNEINTDLDSWDTLSLCVVVCDLFISELSPLERNWIKIILDQRNDLENYTTCASLGHLTFKSKWESLRGALLELLKNVDAKTRFACTRLINSFALEPVKVNKTLIERMKAQTNVETHVMMAIQDKVVTKVHGNKESVFYEDVEFTDGKERTEIKDNTVVDDNQTKKSESPTVFSTTLQYTSVYESEEVTLTCEINRENKKVKWFKYSSRIEESDNILTEMKACRHSLKIKSAMPCDTGIYSCHSRDTVTSAFLNVKESPTVFSTTLQDTSVYESEEVTLTCEINRENKKVKWFKYSSRIEESDNILTETKACRHSLKIKSAMPCDTGIYSCHSRDSVSSAFLNVKDKPIEIVEGLAETETTENDDVTLACKVNVPNKNPVWYYEDTEIKSTVRRRIHSHCYEHKLTILNAKLFDDGKYAIKLGDVTSEAFLTVKGMTNVSQKQQLTDKLYRNWVRGALGLKYLKQGLEEFSNNCVNKHHTVLTNNLPTQGLSCLHCTSDNLLPFQNHANNKICHSRKCLCFKKPKPPMKRIHCPNAGFCSKLYDNIVTYHRYAEPLLANANLTTWSTNPWSVATCYINTTGYKNRKSSREIDCSGLLSVVINNTFFNSELGDVGIDGTTDIFKRARDARNEILHSPNYELSESELNHYLDLFKNVLEMKNASYIKPLEKELGVAEALRKLHELQNGEIVIFEKLEPFLNGLREHSMNEEADKLEEAKAERDKKIELLEDRLKEKEKELKLMRELRAVPKGKQIAVTKVDFEMQINVMCASTKISNKASNEVLEVIKDCTNSDGRIATRKQPTAGLAVSLSAILQTMVQLPDTKITLANDSPVVLKVECFSFEGVNKFMTYVHGKQLQENLFQLRKYLEKDERKAFGIYANITSDSLSSSRKSLSVHRTVQDTDSVYTCKFHSSMNTVWYCQDHDVFCCKICVTTDHISCKNLNHFTSDTEGDAIIKVKCESEFYIKSIKHDSKRCCIFGSCILPDGIILLADNYNRNLKKLDTSYTLDSCQEVSDYPYDVCYIGRRRAVVSFVSSRIQFVEVLVEIKLKETVKLDHRCLGLACHRDTLYITDKHTVYTYNTDGTEKHHLFSQSDPNCAFEHIVPSDDGMKIYIAAGRHGIVTIDNEGNHLFTLKHHAKLVIRDICIGVDGSVFEYDEYSGNVFQIDYGGQRKLGTVSMKQGSLSKLASFIYNKKRSHLIVGFAGKDSITVIELE